MQGGGAERVAALLCNYWVDKGYRVTLVPTFSGRGMCVYPLDSRVRVEFLADRVGTTKKNLWTSLVRLLALRKIIRENSPDVMLSFLTHVNVAVLVACMGLDVPVVVSEHTYPPAMPVGRLLKIFRRFVYPWSKSVIMLTEKGLRWLVSCCPRARGRVIPNPVVIPLPVDHPIVSPDRILSRHRKMLLAVGRLGPEKGYEILLESFSRLAGDFANWDLVILGEGPERENLEKARAALGLEGRVFLPGRVGNLDEWYPRAEIFVMSSRFEGFPSALLEAIAYGVPGVSFDCDTGPRDIIRDGVDGLLVPPDSGAKGLAEALSRLMGDEIMRRRMSAAATDARDRFSLERIGELWDEALFE